VVMTDIMMPKMNGMDMARAIREKKPDIPIFMVSGFDDVEYLKQAIDLKIDGFVLKPVDPDALIALLGKSALNLRRQEELEEQRRLNELMLDFLPHPAMLIDGSRLRILKVNRSASDLGYHAGGKCDGPFFPDLLLPQMDYHRGTEGLIKNSDRIRMEEIHAFERIWDMTLIPVNMNFFFFNAVDVTQRKMTELALESQATLDALTGLPNRFVLQDRLEHALSQSRRYNASFAVLYVDLDYFKFINDTMGHAVGDMVLREVARRLRERVRDSDTLARLGGDEFCILVHNLNSPEDAFTVAESIIEAVRRPLEIEGKACTLGASVGISICPRDGVTGQDLLQKADAAMYRAKGKGRNTSCFFFETETV